MKDSQQQTSTSSEPWAASQPALKTGLDDALKLYNSGVGGKVYTGNTYVGPSAETRVGLNDVKRNAKANMNGKGLSAQYQDLISNGGLTGQQREASGLYSQQIANGGYNPAQQQALQAAMAGLNGDGLNDIQRQALGGFQGLASNPFNSYQQDALKNTQGLANSDYNISPQLQKVLDAQALKVSEAVNANAAGAGRYGSGANQNLLASNVGDLANSTIYNDYTNYLGRKDAANNNLFNMGQTGIGTQLSANGSIAGIGQTGQQNLQNAQNNVFNMGQTGFANQTNAANSLAALGQSGVGNLAGAYAGLNAGANDLMKVGAANEGFKTQALNDKLRIFNEKQNNPWNQIGRLNGIAAGAGSMGGTQTQSQPGSNPFLQSLGYATGGLGLFGSLFG